MTGAEVLAAFLAFAVTAAPHLKDELAELAAAFRQGHPELGDPPPPDGEAKVDAEIDTQLRNPRRKGS